MTQMIRFLRSPAEIAPVDCTLVLGLAIAVLANGICLWSYL